MIISEIRAPITSKAINESLAKKFGEKFKVNKFTVEHLEDARNKIRTKMSQFETNESFDQVHSNDEYQKNKLFLDVLNQAISERDVVNDEDQVIRILQARAIASHRGDCGAHAIAQGMAA